MLFTYNSKIKTFKFPFFEINLIFDRGFLMLYFAICRLFKNIYFFPDSKDLVYLLIYKRFCNLACSRHETKQGLREKGIIVDSKKRQIFLDPVLNDHDIHSCKDKIIKKMKISYIFYWDGCKICSQRGYYYLNCR